MLTDTKSPNADRRKAGFSVFMVLIFVTAILLVMLSISMVTRGAFLMSETIDIARQTSVERRSLEQIVKEAILAKIEVAPSNSTSSVDSIIDGLVSQMNQGSLGSTVSRSCSASSLPVHRMFPDVATPTITNPDLAAVGTDYQTAALIRGGAVEITAPMSWTFNRSVSVSAENKVHTVTARIWSVPFSNYGLIAYGLPASVASSNGIARTAPSNATSIITSTSFTSNGGHPLIVTTLRPNPPYSDGDTTAFDTLYSAPTSGNETLPRYYRPLVSLAWNAWEYVLSNAYQTTLLNAAGTNLYDFDAFNTPVVGGVTTNSSTSITANLQSVSGNLLAIVDGIGGRDAHLTAASSGTPLVVAVRNSGASRFTVNLWGVNQRTTLLYVQNTNVVFQSGASFQGAIILDQNSTITILGASAALQGFVAFYAPNNFPVTNLVLTPPTGTVKTDLDAIAPRAVVISTSSSTN